NLFASALKLFEADFAADFQAAAAGFKIVFDSFQAAEHAAGGKVRPFNVGHQLSKSDAWVIDLGADPVDDFTQVVRWDIGGHADGNAGAAVDQQVWERRGKNRGLGLGFIIVRDEIDRVLVHVIHQHGAQWREAGLS